MIGSGLSTALLTSALVVLTGAGDATGQERQDCGPLAEGEVCAPEPAHAESAAVESATVPGVEVHYLRRPWDREAFESFEAPSPPGPKRMPWLLALVETRVPLSVDGKRLDPGRYVLVCHPNEPVDHGLHMEIRRVTVPGWVLPRDLMAITLQGESMHRAPVRFDLAAGTSPALTVRLAPHKGGITLTVRYGDRAMVKEFRR